MSRLWLFMPVCLLMLLVGAGHRLIEASVAPSTVEVAMLVYAGEQTAECFSDGFLEDVNRDTTIRAQEGFVPVRLQSMEMFNHPYAIISGSGSFQFSSQERRMMRDYLSMGGFVVASAGCSDSRWAASYREEMRRVFPDVELVTLEAGHPVYHTVYDITRSEYRTGEARLPELEALMLDGRIVMIFSPDGLNDTDNAGGNCCCCGGNEVYAARQLNFNLLAYALTH